MRRLWRREPWCVGLVVSVVACSEAPVPITEPAAVHLAAASVPIEPDPDPGEDTYFDADVTWEFTGDYDGFDFPTADRAVTFHVLQVVQLEELRTYVSRSSPMQILTSPVPVDLDSATLVPSVELRSTERGVGTFTPPDSLAVHNNWTHSGQLGSPPAALRTGGPAVRSAVAAGRRIRPRTRTGGFVGPETAAAELTRLRASGASEERISARRLRFRLSRSQQDYQLDYDETVGAVVEVRIAEVGRSVATVTREFRPVRGGHQLAAETTQLYGPDGAPRERFRQRYEGVRGNANR